MNHMTKFLLQLGYTLETIDKLLKEAQKDGGMSLTFCFDEDGNLCDDMIINAMWD